MNDYCHFILQLIYWVWISSARLTNILNVSLISNVVQHLLISVTAGLDFQLHFVFHGSKAVVGLLIFRFCDHTQTYHTLYDSSVRVIGPLQRPICDNTQHSQQTDILEPGGIWPLNRSKTERPQTRTSDHSATGIVQLRNKNTKHFIFVWTDLFRPVRHFVSKPPQPGLFSVGYNLQSTLQRLQ